MAGMSATSCHAPPTRWRVVVAIEKRSRACSLVCRKCFCQWVDQAEAIPMVGLPAGNNVTGKVPWQLR